MSRIKNVIGRRVWDSRGWPTVEVEVHLENGLFGRGMAPAGASCGMHEAVELRDGGSVLSGKDVQKALHNIQHEIAPALIGTDINDQKLIDSILIELDGTGTFSRLGGNASVACSMAAIYAAANNAHLPLWKYLAGDRKVAMPLPQIQIFGGGAHAGRRIDIQDLMVIANGAKSFEEALVMTAEVYHSAGRIMKQRGHLSGVADEGGWWPEFSSNEQALDTLVKAIESAGYVPGQDVSIALDIASSEFGKEGRYRLALEATEYDSDGMCELLLGWLDRYPILSIEDPLAEDDEQGLIAFTNAAGSRVQIVGDDYFVTNGERVKAAAEIGACNAVLLKANQAGTITQLRHAFSEAQKAGYGSIVSARSGETEDNIIVHLALGLNAGQLKVGSMTRSERTSKWNEAIRLEEANALGFFGIAALDHK
ncbi:phosphopyruvate hydratase [Citrobacter sp. BDA59-3]|uniref:phosphopyruvate hydratase n=1 Tax=Citrobacter sp. BDA59-3 TaxID=2781952 RepID=UPI001881DFF3|nr:phosphopyruvate hydratase [Citrobacter sp. BDA59-3]QOV69734.1 phosphopyruvate hydratase [Citrobacter sp. BDA59-3]